MAPLQLLLLRVFCWQSNSEFMEVIDPNNSDPYLHVMHVHSGETHYTAPRIPKRLTCMQTVPVTWVRTASSLPPIILCIVLWRQILR